MEVKLKEEFKEITPETMITEFDETRRRFSFNRSTDYECSLLVYVLYGYDAGDMVVVTRPLKQVHKDYWSQIDNGRRTKVVKIYYRDTELFVEGWNFSTPAYTLRKEESENE